MADRTTKLKIVLTVTAGLIAISAFGAFYLNRRSQANLPSTRPPETASEASMALSQIRQTATKDGVVQWKLEAETAELRSESGELVLHSPVVHFFLDDGSEVKLTAREGVLHTRNNDIQVHGNVIVDNDRYTLETDALAYHHKLRLLESDVPVRISGRSIDLQAATMKYDLNKNQAEFTGRVRGVLNEDPSI